MSRYIRSLQRGLLLCLSIFLLSACGGGGSSSAEGSSVASDTSNETDTETSTDGSSDGSTDDSATDEAATDSSDPIDITKLIFDERSGDCGNYANDYQASVLDIQRSQGFDAAVTIAATATHCVLSSDGIPNHDFNDATASFATAVSEVNRSFTISRAPAAAASTTALSQGSYDAVMLNGVVVDLLSAGCYDPGSPGADPSGNVQIGCQAAVTEWLLDPLSPHNGFGADAHNAHTQPDGTYHYHGNPNALFDDNPGSNGSPVIGFAADGYPIYGSYFYDGSAIRKAVSGYTLKTGTRTGANSPGGSYDGQYIQDYEFTSAGDLDECNGMTVDGQYGYYVTDSYPWIVQCFTGSPDESFNK